MKRSKLAAFLLTVAILLCAKNLYWERLIKITFFTDLAELKAVKVLYVADGKAQSVRTVIKGGGRGLRRPTVRRKV